VPRKLLLVNNLTDWSMQATTAVALASGVRIITAEAWRST
jgi:hypothetical protein